MSNPAKDDLLDLMMAWEEDSLSHDETIKLFQRLVDNGMAWKLQGAYGRTAAQLITLGEVTMKEE